MIVNHLFGDIVRELNPLIGGCESSFISNFIVSFAYRKIFAGDIVQYGKQESEYFYIVWQGEVAVTELTEYEEPIVVYKKG